MGAVFERANSWSTRAGCHTRELVDGRCRARSRPSCPYRLADPREARYGGGDRRRRSRRCGGRRPSPRDQRSSRARNRVRHRGRRLGSRLPRGVALLDRSATWQPPRDGPARTRSCHGRSLACREQPIRPSIPSGCGARLPCSSCRTTSSSRSHRVEWSGGPNERCSPRGCSTSSRRHSRTSSSRRSSQVGRHSRAATRIALGMPF